MRILAVDDEPYILELLPMLAAKVGFADMVTVPSGRAALDLLERDTSGFDCLILDINMPEMDGIELCSRVRQLSAYNRVPIIMLTAMSEREFIDKAFRAGATDYATKPFDIGELGARLRVAQELVTARQEAAAAAQTALGEGRTVATSLSEAIAVDGVRDLVDFVSLNNYLKQCSRAGLSSLQVFAVKVDHIEIIHARASTEEFLYALREVADAIGEAMRISIAMMAYAGDGVFVVVSNDSAALSPLDIEADVQHLLDEKNSEFDDGHPLDLEVSVGSPIRPNVNDIADMPKSVERAIARAALRSKSRRDTPRTPTIRRVVQ